MPRSSLHTPSFKYLCTSEILKGEGFASFALLNRQVGWRAAGVPGGPLPSDGKVAQVWSDRITRSDSSAGSDSQGQLFESVNLHLKGHA